MMIKRYYLKRTILRKTTASMPPMRNSSSSFVWNASTIQLREVTNPSKQIGSLGVFLEASLPPKYTLTLLGSFLNMEWSNKRTAHRPILIPIEVKRAKMSIFFCYVCKLCGFFSKAALLRAAKNLCQVLFSFLT